MFDQILAWWEQIRNTLTSGRFFTTLGALFLLWAFIRPDFTPPTEADIAAYLVQLTNAIGFLLTSIVTLLKLVTSYQNRQARLYDPRLVSTRLIGREQHTLADDIQAWWQKLAGVLTSAPVILFLVGLLGLWVLFRPDFVPPTEADVAGFLMTLVESLSVILYTLLFLLRLISGQTDNPPALYDPRVVSARLAQTYAPPAAVRDRPEFSVIPRESHVRPPAG